MWSSAGPDDAPDTAPDQHARPRHVAPLRTANGRTARLGLERPPTTAELHTRPLRARAKQDHDRAVAVDPTRTVLAHQCVHRRSSLPAGKDDETMVRDGCLPLRRQAVLQA